MIELTYSQFAIGCLMIAGVFMLVGMIIGNSDSRRREEEPEEWEVYDQEPYIREVTKDD